MTRWHYRTRQSKNSEDRRFHGCRGCRDHFMATVSDVGCALARNSDRLGQIVECGVQENSGNRIGARGQLWNSGRLEWRDDLRVVRDRDWFFVGQRAPCGPESGAHPTIACKQAPTSSHRSARKRAGLIRNQHRTPPPPRHSYSKSNSSEGNTPRTTISVAVSVSVIPVIGGTESRDAAGFGGATRACFNTMR